MPMDIIIYKGVSSLTIGDWTRLFRQLDKTGAKDDHEAARLIGEMPRPDYNALFSLGPDMFGRQVVATIDDNYFLKTYTLWKRR